MRIPSIMAAVRKANAQVLERAPSAGARNKIQTLSVRNFHPNSSPVYKTQSETALTAGMKNLTITDRANTAGRRSAHNRGSATTTVKSLADAAGLLQNEAVKNVVIVAGAGISTPSGIPDFRSPGTGLYDNLQQYQIPYPEAIFDIDYFHANPRPFFTLAKELYPTGKYRPNYIHYFIRLLHDRGLLLRMYTQNIDGLERISGVPEEKLVEAHGTFATATCTNCRQKYAGNEIKEKIFSDKLPRCKTRGCVGIVKPDIVFFGEDLPRKFYSYMKDMLQTDLVLVMGTSLEVQPFAGIIDTVRWSVPRILFNREAVGPFKYSKRSQDIVATGDLIQTLQKFATMIGWSDDMKELIIKEEGEFRVATVMTSEINKPVATEKPTTQNNKKGDTNYSNLLWRQNATLNMYRYSNDSDSSSETDSDESDLTSSDSSEEEVKPNRRPGVVRGRVSNVGKNGANLRNGFRSNSAKLGDNNSRKLHTGSQPQTTRNGGNFTGRTVKSDSSVNGTLLKRLFENTKLNPRKDQSKTDTTQQSNKTGLNDKLEQEKVENRKLNPQKEQSKPDTTQQSNKTGLNNRLEQEKVENTKLDPHKDASKMDTAQQNSTIEFSDELDHEKVDNTKPQPHKEQSKTATTIQVNSKIELSDRQEREKVVKRYGINSKPPTSTFWKPSDALPKHKRKRQPKNARKLSTDSNSATGSCSTSYVEKGNSGLTSDLQSSELSDMASNTEDSDKCIDGAKEFNSTADIQIKCDEDINQDSAYVDKSVQVHVCTDSTSNDRLTDSGDIDKKSTITPIQPIHADPHHGRSRKEISAIKKTQRKVLGHRTERHKHTFKPPSGAKTKQLNELNTRPYGFGQKPPLRAGIGPFQRTNVRTLNSSIGKSEKILRSGSAELPRINYRHQLQPVTRYRGQRTEESDTSSENSR